MGVLKSRYGLQGLDRKGVLLADQPGLIWQDKPLKFYSLRIPPVAPAADPLVQLTTLLRSSIEDCRRHSDFRDLHLYYLDAEGHAVFSSSVAGDELPQLSIDSVVHTTQVLRELTLRRQYEAVGRLGPVSKVIEERRDVFSLLEKYLNAYQLGWGALFFAWDEESRTRLFRHFEPFRSGVIHVQERLESLTLTLQLLQSVPGGDPVAYRPVRESLDSATLAEALAWS